MQVSFTKVSFPSRTARLLAHTAQLAQDWSDYHQLQWILSPNLPDVNALDYYVWGVMLEHYKTFYPKSKNTDGLKKVLQLVWNQLDSINKAILSFIKHTELVWKVGWTSELTSFEKKNFNNVEHWILQVTVHFFGAILKYGRKYCKSCNSGSNESILVKFSAFVENSFSYKSWNFGLKIPVDCREIAFCRVWHFLSHLVGQARLELIIWTCVKVWAISTSAQNEENQEMCCYKIFVYKKVSTQGNGYVYKNCSPPIGQVALPRPLLLGRCWFSLGCGSCWRYIPQPITLIRPIRGIRHCWPRHSHHQVAWLVRSSRFSSVVQGISSFITGRTQRVRVGSQYSTYSAVCYGVPQGSVLGPVLFFLHTVAHHCRPSWCWCFVYADDTLISCILALVIRTLRSDFRASDVVYRRYQSLDVVKQTET